MKLLSLLLLSTCPAMAQEVTFICTTNQGTININDYLGTNNVLTIPSTFHGLPVVSIEYTDWNYYTFSTFRHNDLIEVNIPDTVTNIGYCSFVSGVAWESRNLAAINVDPANPRFSSVDGILFNKDKTALYIFPESKKLQTYTIPDSVMRIDRYAFANCTNLTNVIFGANVATIESGAFGGCINLTHLQIPKSVTCLNPGALNDSIAITVDALNPAYCISNDVLFDKNQTMLVRLLKGMTGNNYSVPKSVTKIEAYAFSRRQSLTNIEIGPQVTQIGNGAFRQCEKLVNINLPDKMTFIGNYMFESCTSLTEIRIPDSVTCIGTNAFAQCFSLTNVVIGDHVTNIEQGAFCDCVRLKHVTLGRNVTSIGSFAFNNCGLTNILIPDRVVSIGEKTFARCEALTNVTIPKTVTNLGRNAFPPKSLR